MKSLSHLIYSSTLILISLTYCSCNSTSYQTQAVAVETKEATAKKEETAVKKKQEATLKKAETEAKKEGKAVEQSTAKAETTQKKEPAAKKTPKPEGKTFTGGATYYADHYHGKQTASGELYDREQKTAAIRTNALPFAFGTMVEVTSKKNGKSVVVKVNDKMSDKAKAIIDLSYQAAKAIGLLIDGRTEVTVRVVSEVGK